MYKTTTKTYPELPDYANSNKNFWPFLAISWPIVHNLVTDKLRNASVVGRVPKIVDRTLVEILL